MPRLTSSRRIKETGCGVPDVYRSVTGTPRVYVVSDVRLYREGLIASLARQSQLDVLGAGCSGDVLSQIAPLRPEVLLLDLAAKYSLTIPRHAQQVLPGLLVVAFAVAEMEENVLACAEAGISGYVTQDGSVEDLVAAVLRALRGEVMCSPRIAALLFSRVATLSSGWATTPADGSLTPREQEIAALVAYNLPNKEIARRLRLGPATIKNHVHNILQKLNIHRRGDIALLQLERNVWSSDAPARTMACTPARPSAPAAHQSDSRHD
jgi:two-component system nitrate/nitrite response regulator NarL